jgi:hypothetical protein
MKLDFQEKKTIMNHPIERGRGVEMVQPSYLNFPGNTFPREHICPKKNDYVRITLFL